MIKILGIAPYEAMKQLMDALAQSRSDVSITSVTRPYMEGLEFVQQTDLSEYDAIISRGGTAELIQEVSPIPVFSVEISHYDILATIKLAQSYGRTFAIVGFPTITNIAQILCDILHYNIPIYTTHSEKEIETTISRLGNENIAMVLGDTLGCRYARQQ